MRELLLRLLGARRPVVIEFDRHAIAHARPGDVLVFTSRERWTPEIVASLQEHLVPMLQREAPGVALCINSPEWQTTVAPASLRATREGQ